MSYNVPHDFRGMNVLVCKKNEKSSTGAAGCHACCGKVAALTSTAVEGFARVGWKFLNSSWDRTASCALSCPGSSSLLMSISNSGSRSSSQRDSNFEVNRTSPAGDKLSNANQCSTLSAAFFRDLIWHEKATLGELALCATQRYR